MERIIDSIPLLKIRKWYDYDVQMLFRILYWCALRPMEAIELEKKDFNFTNRTISLHQTKTKKNDIALIPVRFSPQLKNYVISKEEGRLFEGLTYHAFYTWLKRLGKMLEIESWVTPQLETGEKTVGHIFRKSIGKAMVYGEITDDKGNNFKIPTISKHLRHKKPSMTEDNYLKANISQVAEIF